MRHLNNGGQTGGEKGGERGKETKGLSVMSQCTLPAYLLQLILTISLWGGGGTILMSVQMRKVRSRQVK